MEGNKDTVFITSAVFKYLIISFDRTKSNFFFLWLHPAAWRTPDVADAPTPDDDITYHHETNCFNPFHSDGLFNTYQYNNYGIVHFLSNIFLCP